MALRRLLVWIMVLAMPVKGMAAMAMLACGPAHVAPPAAAAPQAHHAGHAHQAAPAVQAGHAHAPLHSTLPAAHHADHAVADPTPPADAGHDPAGDLSASVKHKCSACAACSAGAALPSQPPALLAAEPAPAQFAAAAVSAFRFVTDGPDRPPRPLLA